MKKINSSWRKNGKLALSLFLAIFLLGCNSKKENPATESFRDLNKNGKLDSYEDPKAALEDRIEDLLSQMNTEEKAGLLFNAISGIDMGEDMGRVDSLITKVMINHLDMPGAATAKELLELNNTVQKIAEGTRLGIPVTFYSDPRHSLRFSEAAGKDRYHSRWPSELGFGAIGDPDLIRTFGDISRQEYTALGIRLALHPMADLATEPRWFRTYTTFGEDAELSAKLTKAYILGFQGDTLNNSSVLTMTKHFPGGGPQKDGMDAHFETGKEQVYPGGMFDYHLKPFVDGALPAKTAQIMLYYGVPVGITEEQVAFGFNREIVTDLLRDSLGYQGVVCTDWALVSDNPAKKASAWGVEDLSQKERVKKILDAGVDMFGGESCADLVVELVKEGSISEARIDASIRRILHDKFVLGLFDDPYLKEENLKVFENESFKEKGKEAQRKSLVLLKNEKNILPLSKNIKVFSEGLDPEALTGYATVVKTPQEADIILLKLTTPYTPVTDTNYFLERIFHQGRLDFPDAEKRKLLDLIHTKPTVSILTMNRPAVIPEINTASKSLIVDFDCEDEILVEMIFGEFNPTGNLPIELPSSVEAVENQKEDVPHDSENPLYPFGHGLSYEEYSNFE
ncbi:glycoside hydrolase family 3 protein [Maribacter arenosus]|uniref:beta-glucosidase n=1 Tax=Maribacter arenosus TaxID=1854708 RepID=A0ABR7VI54_9FLAO|nr:glycoside hydrolase family 3 N-terminal domain-containing protein [Maribacter arenosus]MBD0851822.1 glycoside hydrolase family 3 C-terminal domain-containing protein [Maribacter arenosus]